MSVTRDPGLQPERTALAWRRTGLSAGLVGMVLALALVRLDLPVLAVAAAVVTLGVGILALTHFPDGALSGRPLHAWPALVRITLIVVVTATLGATAALIALLN